MNILIASLLLPHPYADHAAAFWAYKMIRHLSQRHEISLISFVRSEKEREFAKHMEEYCRHVETVFLPHSFFRKIWVRARLLTLTPIAVSHSHCREMRDRIRSLVRREKFDIVQMDCTPMGQYISEISDSVTMIHILDLIFYQSGRFVHNLGLSRRKLEWFIDSVISRHYEPRLYAKFDRVLAVSPKVRDTLLDCSPSANVSVVPVGVDIPEARKTYAPGKGRNLVFMGAMWRQQNVDAVIYFYRSIFGLIRKAVPEVTLSIVGGAPSEEIRCLTRDSDVRVTGYVEDILPYYLESDVSIAPMRIGGGVQCKILDAMAAGLPVIATSSGNDGIGATPDHEIIVADTAEEFAERTIELLQDGNLRKTIGQNGLEFVRCNFGWEQAIRKLESCYQESLSWRSHKGVSL